MGTKSASELVQEARQRVQNLSVDEVAAELGRGNVTLIDLREPAELESGRIPRFGQRPARHARILRGPHDAVLSPRV
jgi:Rhodanese-related sulfurtransferase